MFYGALSTDIKKSSCNWSMFGEWMQTAVTVTNNITESVFTENHLQDAKKQLILPNSPEGDAYTIYFEHTDKDELTTHLRRLAFTIQALLQGEREKNGSLNAFSWYKNNIGGKYDDKKDLNKYYNALMNAKKYGESTDKKYLGKIYLRIGIAVTSEKPDEYQYDNHTSYRLGVIHYSELAEQEAPWECGYAEWVEKDIVKKVKIVENVDILERPNRRDREYIGLRRQKNTSVGGFMVFVQYGELYPADCEDKHNKDLNSMERKRRFIEYHDDAHESLRNSSYKVKIVKVKRDQASMFFIPEVNKDRDADTQNVGQQAVDIYNRLCTLMAILPAGSSIGISYATKASGKLQEVTRDTFDSGEKVDYFGAAVNVAARMEMSTIAHQTREGMTKPLLPDSRVAIAFFGDDKGSTYKKPGYPFSYVVERLGKEKNNLKKDLNFISYRVDKFDLHDINAGSGKLFMISSSLRGPRTFQEGEEVEFQQNSRWKRGKIKDISSTDHSATIQSDTSTYAGITFDNIRPIIKTKDPVKEKEIKDILGELEGMEEASTEDKEDSAVYNRLKF